MNDIYPKLWGGVGEKLSNNNTQWYQHRRIYDSDYIALCVTAEANPYYIIWEQEDENKSCGDVGHPRKT